MSIGPWSRPCVSLLLTSLLFGLLPQPSRAQPDLPAGTSKPCLVLAGADPLDLVRIAQAAQARGRIEPSPGRAGPISTEEVGFLIRDLERIPLREGGWTIRAAKEGGRLPSERLRQLVGDVRAVLAVQHGRDVLALFRRVPGVQPGEIQELEQSVADIARCTLARIGGESVFQDTLEVIRDRRPELEAAVLEPLAPPATGSRQ